jgi:aspartate kinase
MIKVAKFGGSSLADANQFRKVANIVHADKSRRYIVPSAPGKRSQDDIKVTDMLYECYHKANEKKDFSEKLKAIKDRYQMIIDDLSLSISLELDFLEIETVLNSADISLDYLASRGEYLNGKLLACYLNFTFVDPKEVIIFSNQGNLLADETNELLSKYLINIEKAVIPGFYGADETGRIKIFSRGGSDITGSIVARAVKASIYENWTDVSGFLVSDPRIVKDAEVIDLITYKELRELSYMGAEVLHEEAVFPIRKEGIPINIKNTNSPLDYGTMIVDSTDLKPEHIITGIAGKKNFVAINIEKELMNSEVGFGRKVLGVFENNGIPFEHAPSGIDTMTVFVHHSQFDEKETSVLSSLQKDLQLDSIDVEKDFALIAIVGRGMRGNIGIASRIFNALAKRSINIKMIVQGPSELNIILGVKNSDFEIAIQALYDEFVK